jgi:hypothetical protein
MSVTSEADPERGEGSVWIARNSWLALVRNVFPSFESRSICCFSIAVNLDDGLGEGLGLLRQVVTDAPPRSD